MIKHKLLNENLSTPLSGKYKLSFALEYVRNGFKKLFYLKGEILFKEGNPSQGLYFLEEGKIKLYKVGKDGQEQIIQIAQAGDIIGYTALSKDVRYKLSAAIIEDATLTFIPKQNFLDNLADGNSTESFFSKLLYQVKQKIVPVAYPAVKRSLIGALLGWSRLANLFSTAKETIIRLWSELKSERLITHDVRVMPLLHVMQQRF